MGSDVTFPAPTGLEVYAERARGYADAAHAENTRLAYRRDMRAFTAWCEAKGASALPAHPSVVLAYLMDHATTLRVTTLQRHLASIRAAHEEAGHTLDTASPAFRKAWRGLKREHGRPAAKKRALMTARLRAALDLLPDTLLGVRDRALILVGFAAALRRSELAGLELAPRERAAWVEDTPDGLVVHLGPSKTDQAGAGADIGIPYGANPATCPVRSFRAWISAAGLTSGPAFRAIDRHGHIGSDAIADRTVARVVKRTIEAAAIADGASPEEATRIAAAYAGHSLRSGLATSAAANDAPGHAIQRQLRHKRFDTTSGYIQAGQLFKQNPAGMVGL